MPDDPVANPSKEAFTDLLSHLERLETQTGAILLFLKDNGTITDEKLAPYLEQASKASDVRMRAARARLNHLFAADETAKPSTEAVHEPAQKEAGQATAKPGKSEDKRAGKTTNADHHRAPDQPTSDEKPKPEAKNEPSEITAGRETVKDDRKDAA